MTVPDDGSPTRRELELLAFGPASTPEEVRAAQDALEQLVARDAATSATANLAQEAEATEQPAENSTENPVGDEPDVDEPDVDPGAGHRRRQLAPLLIVVALFVGAGIGVVVERSQSTVGGSIAADAVGRTPTPSPVANAAAALKSLVVPQTRADTTYPLPNYSTTLDIQPASIHRIMVASNGATLWTGRSDTDICLMWTAPRAGQAVDGGIACATPTAFARGGLTISKGLVSWAWDGEKFTTTIGK
jgi:hypothetical protein